MTLLIANSIVFFIYFFYYIRSHELGVCKYTVHKCAEDVLQLYNFLVLIFLRRVKTLGVQVLLIENAGQSD